MKKILLSLLLIPSLSYSQKDRDTIIQSPILTSIFSKTYQIPKEVVYKLYKGGGDCSRSEEGFRFHAEDSIKVVKNQNPSYAASFYDIGHMANAEDFAYDCKKEELTFRFYNAIPQTSKCNRGVWKRYETEIRKLSQIDSLLVECGPVMSGLKKHPEKDLWIPNQCYKVVYSLSTGTLLYCLLFENDDSSITAKSLTIREMEKVTGLRLTYKKRK